MSTDTPPRKPDAKKSAELKNMAAANLSHLRWFTTHLTDAEGGRAFVEIPSSFLIGQVICDSLAMLGVDIDKEKNDDLCCANNPSISVRSAFNDAFVKPASADKGLVTTLAVGGPVLKQLIEQGVLNDQLRAYAAYADIKLPPKRGMV
ncbi:MAG: hypothetical protein EBR02_07380 [Alphaproteobacteria bacterium]|nr:hypothetical protein [Alphaproteobacteria bacterium]